LPAHDEGAALGLLIHRHVLVGAGLCTEALPLCLLFFKAGLQFSVGINRILIAYFLRTKYPNSLLFGDNIQLALLSCLLICDLLLEDFERLLLEHTVVLGDLVLLKHRVDFADFLGLAKLEHAGRYFL